MSKKEITATMAGKIKMASKKQLSLKVSLEPRVTPRILSLLKGPIVKMKTQTLKTCKGSQHPSPPKWSGLSGPWDQAPGRATRGFNKTDFSQKISRKKCWVIILGSYLKMWMGPPSRVSWRGGFHHLVSPLITKNQQSSPIMFHK